MALAGLRDSDPYVQRAAADALGCQPAPQFIRPLLEARQECGGVAARRMRTRTQHVARDVEGLPCRPRLAIGADCFDRLRERLALQMTIRKCGHLFPNRHRLIHFIHLLTYQRLPDWLSSSGLTLAEMASRARKIRERTVPMGQSMTSAISS